MPLITKKYSFLFFALTTLIAAFTYTSANAQSNNELSIEEFTPQNTASEVRQVRVRFSEPMIAFADPRVRADLFSIDCITKGNARWADQNNWIFDFEEEVPGGNTCTFTLKETVKSLSGKSVSGNHAFSFSTGGPLISSSIPGSGDTIAEDQAFILKLSGEADTDDILSHAWFEVEGLNDRISLAFVGSSDRELILRNNYGKDYKPQKTDVVVRARQRFVSDGSVSLVWGTGIRSVHGVPTQEENRLTFSVRSAFGVTLGCQRANSHRDCIPFSPISATFSAPIAIDDAKEIYLKDSKERKYQATLEANENSIESLSFKGPFPPKEKFQLVISKSLEDDSGRTIQLESTKDLSIATDVYPPLAKFPASFGVLETASSMLPITVRDIEPELLLHLTSPQQQKQFGSTVPQLPGRVLRVTELPQIISMWQRTKDAEDFRSVFEGLSAKQLPGETEDSTMELIDAANLKTISVPRPHNKDSFEVVGIPLPSPGFYVVEVESPRLGDFYFEPPQPEPDAPQTAQEKSPSFFVRTSALVTDLAVHFKQGKESSLLWVTSLSQAKPIGLATVGVADCNGKTIWEGQTDNNGIALINSPLPSNTATCSGNYGLVAYAQTAKDFSFTMEGWDDGIEPWRFHLPYSYRTGAAIYAHTILSENLVRRGKTVHMKHVIRQATLRGLAIPQAKTLPTHYRIEHQGSGEKYEGDIQWDANGTALSSWSVPESAKLGTYTVSLFSTDNNKRETLLYSGEIRVEDFRVPLMRAAIQPPATDQVASHSVPLQFNVKYLAGGGARELPVKVRYRFESKYIQFSEDFPEYTFGLGTVKAGLQRTNEYDESEEDDSEDKAIFAQKPVEQALTLDLSGTGQYVVKNLPELAKPFSLAAELEYRDPAGETQTVASDVTVWPAAVLVGMKPISWTSQKRKLAVNTAVTSLKGAPLANRLVHIVAFQEQTYSHRKRLVGGFYGYENFREVKELGPICDGLTNDQGIFNCEKEIKLSGNILLQAQTKDDQGHLATTYGSVWVENGDDWWFQQSDGDRIDILADKKRYDTGETATIQVRTPFRSATALVTVERDGILDSFVTELNGENPVVQVPIKESYIPNVFVSVAAVRGRIGDVQPSALLDLGKPAFKLGITELKVARKDNELVVKVSTDREVYQVRDQIKAHINVSRANGQTLSKDAEVALIAVDEGVLELLSNPSWDLLDGMLRQRNYEIRTSSAQLQVIGKRHFGLKALPAGGGGGNQNTRQLFDTLLLWRGKLSLDNQGNADIDIPLNDSITSFKIIAVAQAGISTFGTGTTSVRTTQDVMTFSGIPPLVREGDKAPAEFTIRNTTEHAMPLELSISVTSNDSEISPLPAQIIRLEPSESKRVSWSVLIPASSSSLTYNLNVRELDGGKAHDSLKITQKVIPAVPVRTLQATLAQLSADMRIPIEKPQDALTGQGGIKVIPQASLANSLSASQQYMRDYPFNCLEQRLSRIVSLHDTKAWQQLVAALPTYLDKDGLAKYFPTMDKGSTTLTAYFLSMSKAAQLDIPIAQQQQMITGLKNFFEGYLKGDTGKFVIIPKLEALAALSVYGAVTPEMIEKMPKQVQDLPTSSLLDWWTVLENTTGAKNQPERYQSVLQNIKARLNFQGTQLSFSTSASDSMWWSMISEDLNALRLVYLASSYEGFENDIGRLVRGAIERQKRGHWDLTTANAWATVALSAFSKEFEKEPVEGTTLVTLGNETERFRWTPRAGQSAIAQTEREPHQAEALLPFPIERSELLLSHQGKGKPWLVVQSLAAVPLKAPLSSGYTIKKEIIPVTRAHSDKWTEGDIVKVRLTVDAQADRTWVVLDDPIPGGASILGGGLKRDSTILASTSVTGEDENQSLDNGWNAYPVFEERSFSSYRAYFDYAPRGTFKVEYTLRLNAVGSFQMPTTRVEAMYSPEMFGEIPNQIWEVK